MLFHILHRLTYTYGRPVFLEPMTLRLTPRQDVSQRLERHRLVIEPHPAGLSHVVEPDGTDATVAWFEGTQEHLLVEMEAVVRTLRDNPFEWIVTDPGVRTLPAVYSDGEALSLAPCRGLDGADPAVAAWARELAGEMGGTRPGS